MIDHEQPIHAGSHRDAGTPLAASIRDWLHLLPAGMAPAVLALTLGLTGTAAADIQASPPRPEFSAADLATIARNESLREAVATSPWVVYQVLRAIDAEASQGRDLLVPRPGLNKPTADFDHARDPDLKTFERVAPEAAHDLFLLIKKASKQK
ncbi:hypothetical protein [Rhodoplanes sp. SY1]|uniref:hypothetical protein n=1 Tax=Rhodoplanes sp. SY1 TaxID=3166646 RepID=UPI0038B42CC6